MLTNKTMVQQIQEAQSAVIIPLNSSKLNFSIYTIGTNGMPCVLWQEVGQEPPLRFQRFSRHGSKLPGCYFHVPKSYDNPPMELASLIRSINRHINVYLLDGSVYMSLRPVGTNNGAF